MVPATSGDIEGHVTMTAAEQVAEGGRVLAAEGVSDLIWGHVSARDDQAAGFRIKRAGIGLGEASSADVQLLGFDGAVLEGPPERHLEWPIHAEVLRARPEVGAVVHTHGRAALALMATGVPLQAISHEGTIFVPPSLPCFADTTDLIETPELGAALARRLGDRDAGLLACHGTLAVGAGVGEAVARAVLLERACAVQLQALAAGGVRRSTAGAEALAKRRHFGNATLLAVYEHLVRTHGVRRAAQ